jgi:hypothetical protein
LHLPTRSALPRNSGNFVNVNDIDHQQQPLQPLQQQQSIQRQQQQQQQNLIATTDIVPANVP